MINGSELWAGDGSRTPGDAGADRSLVAAIFCGDDPVERAGALLAALLLLDAGLPANAGVDAVCLAGACLCPPAATASWCCPECPPPWLPLTAPVPGWPPDLVALTPDDGEERRTGD